MRILAIGAHYDDIEVGCGGTLLGHVANGDVVYLAITNSDEHRTGHPVKRFEEQQIVCKQLNCRELITFGSTDDVSDIVGILDSIDADIVFTMFDQDTHQDHRRASSVGTAVGRKKNITTFCYDSGSSYDFHPTVFNVIDYHDKFVLISNFKSQLECGAVNLDIIKKKEAYWASLISDTADHAEAFAVKKLVYPYK